MHRLDDAQRRARLGIRHHLAGGSQRTADAVTVAGDLCGLHATDPVTVFLAARARVVGFAAADLERAMYDDCSAIRMLGMRRTVFVVPTSFAPLIHQACTARIGQTNKRRLVTLLETNSIATDGARWLRDVERDVLAALDERGASLATELSAAVPALRTKVDMAPGKSYGGAISLNNQVLTHLAAAGLIVRGRPQGSWTATKYRWAPIGTWTNEAIDGIAAPQAEAELARRWLASFGPATEQDLTWWTGWTVRQTRRALDAIGAVRVELDGDTAGWVLADDVDPVAEPPPWVALLPALDPTAMGWSGRDFYLGPHRSLIFDRSGNIGPTVWADGRIVGGWAQRADGEIVRELFQDVGRDTITALDNHTHELATWLGDVRFTPRFPTPAGAPTP